jgi:hypothetical protein
MQTGELYILGSALEETTLEQAGIASASEIVIATAWTLTTCLSRCRPEAKIRISGFTRGPNPKSDSSIWNSRGSIRRYHPHWSAMRIANAIARPAVVDFLDLLLPGLRPEEFGLEAQQPRRKNNCGVGSRWQPNPDCRAEARIRTDGFCAGTTNPSSAR